MHSFAAKRPWLTSLAIGLSFGTLDLHLRFALLLAIGRTPLVTWFPSWGVGAIAGVLALPATAAVLWGCIAGWRGRVFPNPILLFLGVEAPEACLRLVAHFHPAPRAILHRVLFP